MENNTTITENSDISKMVYDSLSESTVEIEKLQEKAAELDRKINSGIYDREYVSSDLIPKREQVKQEIRSASNDALLRAENLVSQYKAVADNINILDSELLTRDINLLQPSIVLQPRDIAALMEKNKGNRTMQLIVLRYAEKVLDMNVSDLYSKYLRDGDMAMHTAQIVSERIRYYGKHIGKPRAKEKLNSFFGISE